MDLTDATCASGAVTCASGAVTSSLTPAVALRAYLSLKSLACLMRGLPLCCEDWSSGAVSKALMLALADGGFVVLTDVTSAPGAVTSAFGAVLAPPAQ